MVAALGGPGDFIEAADRHLPRAPVVRPVPAQEAGVVEAVETRAIGLAVIGLGGGRTRPQDAIDARVGFTGLARPGDQLSPNDPIGIVHAADEAAAERAAASLRAAYRIGAAPPEPRKAVLERLG
jgi:thymidine phosphorylase